MITLNDISTCLNHHKVLLGAICALIGYTLSYFVSADEFVKFKGDQKVIDLRQDKAISVLDWSQKLDDVRRAIDDAYDEADTPPTQKQKRRLERLYRDELRFEGLLSNQS